MSWYKWKIGRLAAGPRKGSSIVEGNNRWRRLFLCFWWRVDPTEDGTKD